MAVVTVYTRTERYQLEPIPSILSRCNQALQTLERYKARLNEESTSLTALEVEDQGGTRLCRQGQHVENQYLPPSRPRCQ